MDDVIMKILTNDIVIGYVISIVVAFIAGKLVPKLPKDMQVLFNQLGGAKTLKQILKNAAAYKKASGTERRKVAIAYVLEKAKERGVEVTDSQAMKLVDFSYELYKKYVKKD